MTTDLVQKLTGVRDLKKILETTVKELGEVFNADACQIMLSNPLDANCTSICEYKATGVGDDLSEMPSATVPLMLHGRTLGALSISRQQEVVVGEVNAIRSILGELSDVIRHAQINDVVQRDTFRETFLVEIGNVMSYSMGIGDALFMVVNILGKVLQASRCIFICTDEKQAGWKCFEFWQQDKVQSCQDYHWPTTDSPVVAQVLLSGNPLHYYEGQQNSYVSPVQDELQFINAKSLLGIALRSEETTHGCVILQQCDYRRAWTRGEIDMVQNVADKVADAISKLPAEKRGREPIMQLHQRIVAPVQEVDSADAFAKIDGVRKALKGALGQQAIPSARGAKPAAPKAAPVQPQPAAPVQPAQQAPVAPPSQALPQAPAPQTLSQQQVSTAPPPAPAAIEQAPAPPVQAPSPPPAVADNSVLGGILSGSTHATPLGVDNTGAATSEAPDNPYSNLDFGDFTDFTQGEQQEVASPSPLPAQSADGVQGAPAAAATPAAESQWGNLDDISVPVQTAPVAQSNFGNLDAIGTPPVAQSASASAIPAAWGDLDSIAAPTSAPTRSGLGGAMFGKARAASSKGLIGREKSETPEPPPQAPAAPPVEIDEVAAEAKLKQIMSSSSASSDYVFATPGLHMRTLGRIDSWVREIEEKDAFQNGHAMQTAMYAVAIAQEAGLSQEQIDVVRQAALVHDLGKLGSPAALLQKPEEQLEDPELLAIMRHPISGAELLDSFPDLKHLAPIILAHREEFNGEGFPQGLQGAEIPVESRVIAVANGYHSLISAMKYGPGIEPSAAQIKLVEEAGKKYDPTFVQSLVQAIMVRKVPASI